MLDNGAGKWKDSLWPVRRCLCIAAAVPHGELRNTRWTASHQMGTIISIGHDGMGHGDPDLGRRILGTFLKKSVQIQDLSAITFHNSGVRLVAPDSPVLIELTQLHERGIELKPCRTCLEHYGLLERIAVGDVSTMDEIVAEWSRAGKVIAL